MKRIINNILFLLVFVVMLVACNNTKNNTVANYDLCSISTTGLPIDSLYAKGLYNTSKNYYNYYLDTATNISDLQRAKVTRNLGVCYSKLGAYDSANFMFKSALSLFDSTHCFLGITRTYSNLSVLCCKTNKQSLSIDYGIKSIEMMEDFEAKESNKKFLTKDFYIIKSDILINIGVVYKYNLDNNEALKYYNEALTIAKKFNNVKRMITLYHNIANVLSNSTWTTNKDISKALDYYRKELEYARMQCNCLRMSYVYYSISDIYRIKKFKQYSLDTNKMYLDYSYKILKNNFVCDYNSPKCNVDLSFYSKIMCSYADYYYENKDFVSSLQYAKKALKIANKAKELTCILTSYSVLAKVFYKIGDYKNANKYSYLNLRLKEKQINDKTNRSFENNKQVRISNKNKILEAKNINQKIKIRSKNLLIIGGGAIAVSVILALMFFLRYRIKYEQKIKVLNNQLLVKNNDVINSINYAKRIQQAVLPPKSVINELFPENFVFYKPKDVISGDFYWTTNVDQYKIFAVADCTGHGVPGALLSMIGISYLNEIVLKQKVTQANEVLNELRKQVIYSLRQTNNGDEEIKDGIDTAICVIDTKNYIMQYAGAFNPLYIVSKTENKVKLNEIKADRMPVSMPFSEYKSFTNNECKIKKGDIIYMFSDGFTDQFGGVENKKYKSSKFKNLILKMHDLPLNEQNKILNNELQKWMGVNEQVDDILVVGIKV